MPDKLTLSTTTCSATSFSRVAYNHVCGQYLDARHQIDAYPSSSPTQETDKVTQREKTTVMPVVHVTRNLLSELYGGEATVSSAHSQKIGQGLINYQSSSSDLSFEL